MTTSHKLAPLPEPDYCPTCGRTGGQMYTCEDRDDSVGYRSEEIRCTKCNESDEPAPIRERIVIEITQLEKDRTSCLM